MRNFLTDHFALNKTTLELGEVFILTVLLMVFFSAIIFMKKKRVGRQSFLLLTIILLVSFTIVILYSNQVIRDQKIMLITRYLAESVAATSLLFFSFQYASRRDWLTFPRSAIFFVEPIVFLFLILRLSPEVIIQNQIFPAQGYSFIFWHYLHQIYLGVILLLAIIIVAPGIFLGVGAWRQKAIIVLAAVFIPMLPLLVEFDRALEIFSLEMFGFVVSSILLGLALLQSSTVDLMPFSRNLVVEQMREGWLLLDNQNRIIDANPSAEELLNFSKTQAYGKNANKIFASWPNIINTLIDGQEADFKSSSGAYGEELHLHIRIFHIKDFMGLISGCQILLSDYTERRIAESARQQARDEMFSLLHSISGAASDTEDTNEFITASMYQLAYSFTSQTTAVFLNDQEAKDDDLFLLVANQGIEAKYIERLAFLDRRHELVSLILTSWKSLLIDDIQTDSRIPTFFRDALVGSLLTVPIIAEDELVGLILLTRETKTYSDDEISRLEIAAEQIGSFVRSNRRRGLASTLAERQRLIRDLHDSVTQRLYGLVMKTETAKLSLQSGKLILLNETIAELGFDARQALKEMRLFLHKLQPIDLERYGLAVVLMRRLEAVEGRANLETDIDIDENITLGPEEELALFFIAQEALNNIIRHANANAIKVKLKKARVNIRLEISDNGCGFDVKTVNQFGLGLKNMYTRTKQIGAKIRVSSEPEKGTKITVLLRHSKP